MNKVQIFVEKEDRARINILKNKMGYPDQATVIKYLLNLEEN